MLHFTFQQKFIEYKMTPVHGEVAINSYWFLEENDVMNYDFHTNIR